MIFLAQCFTLAWGVVFFLACATNLRKSKMGHVWDVLVILGACLVVWGAGLIYAPLAPTVGGLFLLLMGVLGAIRWDSSEGS